MTARTILNVFVAVSRQNNTSRNDHLGKGFVKKTGHIKQSAFNNQLSQHATNSFQQQTNHIIPRRRRNIQRPRASHGYSKRSYLEAESEQKHITGERLFFSSLFKNRVPKKGYFPHKIDQTAIILRLKKFIKNTGRGKANSIDILCAIFSGLKN